ncbi:MAG: response regulator [Kiloniellales bacterium]|jgi:DNA-binding response OmpR family regulator
MAHILIIDDDELVRITLHTMLERAGYETTMATNGQDGLMKFNARPADLIILDMILPEKGGIEVFAEFRQAQPDVKIIAISGGVWGKAIDNLQTLKDLGADHYLAKPIGRHELLEVVGRLLAQ